ncbi:hypothetical protein [Pedobacter sp. L105]|uniref:hypothetical protein n=1 Tax=Pedobacter sp. L105 TaxID=1641871 RepID=UPI00131C7B45|nr:hypothetical protein [Pedobacter sp. L105]
MYNKKLHGLHNSKACELLIQSGDGEFNDWVVTTAFYSALHLVHHHLFPLLVFRRMYKTFDSYYNNQYPEQELPKHTVTKDLVFEYLFVISSKYNWLFKECYNARYRSYHIDGAVAKTAKGYLEEIKSLTIE